MAVKKNINREPEPGDEGEVAQDGGYRTAFLMKMTSVRAHIIIRRIAQIRFIYLS
jgi:hypothetical protein